MDNTFKFYLKAGASGYYYVENNIVLLSVLKRPLEYDIVSWKDIEVSLTRVMDNWGVLREYTIDLSFIEDGKKIIDFIVANNPFVGELSLEIEKLNTATQTYALWAVCDIDLSTYSSDTIQATVNSKEGGLVALMRSRSNVEYTIDFASGAANIEVGNTRLGARSRWIVGNNNEYAGAVSLSTRRHKTYFIFPMSNSDNVQAGNFIRPFDQQFMSSPDGFNGIPNGDNIFTPPVGVTNFSNTTNGWQPFGLTIEDVYNVNITGNVQALVRPLVGINGFIGTLKLHLWVVDRDNYTAPVSSRYERYFLGSATGFPSNQLNGADIPFALNIPFIRKGKTIYLVLENDNNSGISPTVAEDTQNAININASWLQMDYRASVPASIVKGYRYIDFITKFVDKMTDGAFTIQSSFLRDDFNNVRRAQNFDSKPRDVFVCSGDSLRGLSSAKITTTWDNILKDLWSLYGVIPSYRGNTIILEDMRTMLRNTVVFRTKSINNLNISAFREKVFNQVKVGQTASETNNVVGRNEFNTQITFVVENNTLAEGVLDLSSPFRRDVYGIESARAEGFNRDKLDGQFDKDIFLIEVSSALNAWGRFTPYRVLGHISGVDDPNGVYNIPLSPKRCLMRNLRYIRSFFSSGMLNYVSTQKNPDLISNIRVPYNAIGNIIETADINLSLGTSNGNGLTPLFKPFVVEFDTDTDYNLVELTENNLNGLVEFEHNGLVFQGYILDIGVKPATRDTYRFRLLMRNSTDITKLQ